MARTKRRRKRSKRNDPYHPQPADPCGFEVVLATPVILSNALVTKALSELLGG